MSQNTDYTEITKRLDAIIRLQIAQLHSKSEFDVVQLYAMLTESGLTTGDVAKIVGGQSKNISSAINKLKKKKQKKESDHE